MTGETLCEELLGRVRELAPLIREHADAAERERHLADPVVNALREAGLYRMATPRELGGLGVDLVTFYRVVEEVASIDGSTGWCMFINGGCPLTGAYLPLATAREIYGDPGTIVSGTVFPFGRAERAGGGYQVSGRWQYASGSWHTNWHFVFCNVYEPGAAEPEQGPLGTPLVVVPHIPRSEVELIDTWDVSGLAGTGSHDVQIDTFVPEDRVWSIGMDTPRSDPYQGAFYRVPFLAGFAWPIAAVAVGIARGAIAEVSTVARSKRSPLATAPLIEQPLFQQQIAQATAKVESARTWLYARMQDMSDKAQRGEPVTLSERGMSQLAATNATHESAAAVELAYRAGGASANFRRSPLQRALRDANAVTQHFATAPAQYPAAGAVLLGLPPANALMHL